MTRRPLALPRPAPGGAARDPGRGGHAARRGAGHLSELTGCDVWLKLEGANPTGSFKDRGHDRGRVRRRARGGGGGGLRLHRQHRGQRRRLRGPRRPARGGDRARGQDRHRQAGPGADARRAGDRAARQLRRGAGAGARAGRSGTRSRSSTRSTTSASRARRPARSRSATSSARRPTCSASRSATPGNVTAWWKGFQEYGTRPALHGYQAEGAAPLVHGRAGGAARDGGLGDPDRQPGALGGRDGRLHRPRAARCARCPTTRSSTRTRCSARARACSASRPRRRRWPGCSSYGAEGRVVCVLTGHGLKDPQTAMNRAASVVPCEPDLDERRARRCCGVKRRRLVPRARVLGQPRPGLRRAGRGAVARRSSSRWRRPASSSVDCDVPGRAARPLEPLRARLRGAAPRRRAGVPHPLRDPAGRRARLERRGDRGRAGGGRPHVRARRAAVRARRASSRATPTTWPPRCYGGFVVCARRTSRSGSTRRPGSRACSPSRRTRCRTAEARAALPAEVPMADAVHNVAHASLLVLGPGAGRPLADRPRARRPPPPAAPRAPLPALDGAGRAGGGAGRGGRDDLGRRARRSCSGATGSRPGAWSERCKAEAPDCDVRRVTFAPGGADVSEL